ncbi:MAG: hypothetical protein GC159_05735 [Phycisphaera sp.]|nr:hypothetical protein [Phycisphaera sp.]
MLKFLLFNNGERATEWRSSDAYLVGADDVAVKANIAFADGVISCEKNTVGPAALSLPYSLDETGELMLQTCLLPERDDPYMLTVELARHRLMKVISKQEDWGLYDLEDDHPAAMRIRVATQKFVEALSLIDKPAEADKLARQALALGIDASEELALAQAERQLSKRLEKGNLTRHAFGCGISLKQDLEALTPTLLKNFDYVRLPTPWRELEPNEQEYNLKPLDRWCHWAYTNRIPIVAGPIVSFAPHVVPDWLYIWQHDYDTVRDLLYEHVERVVRRYGKVVSLWNVVSGLHVNDNFSFNFEQLMDLTRMAVMLTKKAQPNAKTLIEITHPFGEYYANNTQSIPPLMYAEMVLQSGIPFDGFGLKVLMGQPKSGQFTRDLMQLSALLDRFHGLGKPMYVTAVGVPSKLVEIEPTEDNGTPLRSGYWRKPWSGVVQGKWLEAFYNVCLSKTFVESVAWLDLADHADSEMPDAGLIKGDMQPKRALSHLATMRSSLYEDA